MQFPMDVGGVLRDGGVTTELGTGSLRQAVGILTPEDFQTSFEAIVNLVFAGEEGQLVVADVAIKGFELQVIVIYVPNCIGETFLFPMVGAVP